MADSAVETVVDGIKSLIDKRNLSVGDALPSERELCEMFASSRNTVREAMRILKAYGVVDVKPKIGAIIIDRRMDAVFELYSFNTLELSRETFLDTQGFRTLVEVGAVDQLFEKAEPADIAELRRLNEVMAAARETRQAAEGDFAFHYYLISILDNRQLKDVYRIMKPVMLKIMENGIAKRKQGWESFVEHGAIIDALEVRNRIAFKFEMSRHLEAGLALFKEGAGPG
ncbi:FadR/GntR family transcriptional regulator [Pelagibacterium limicola]|uniref:FadR/GntR family transcriptional regulator n=1 Tax=Pelagibacterium limicola TaxID=2791022 RepID=UPI001FEBC985|nr:FCD domain-containing protein [Pelagibacterium limicola]